MHSLVPFFTVMGRFRSKLSIESMKVSPGCVSKGGYDLTVISFPGFASDSWTCFVLEWPFPLSTP